MSSDTLTSGATLSRAVVIAGLIGLVSALTIGGAWAFQIAGYAPCELCLKGRIPHYAGVPLAALTVWLAWRGRRSLLPAAFTALTLIFGIGAVFSAYHAGVEWHLWAGPSSCIGAYTAPSDVGSFLDQLKTANVVRCDAAALHISGLSLAVWNAIICAALAVLAALGFRDAVAEDVRPG